MGNDLQLSQKKQQQMRQKFTQQLLQRINAENKLQL